MAALSSSTFMPSPTYTPPPTWGASSSILFADGLSRFDRLLEESLCKEPSKIEEELMHMTISITDPCLCGEGLKTVNLLFVSAISKIEGSAPANPSKLVGKQRENALANIKKIWAKYKEALDKKINHLANDIDLIQQQVRLMNAQLKHTSDRITEVSGFRLSLSSSSDWIPPSISDWISPSLHLCASKHLASFPADWQPFRPGDVLVSEDGKEFQGDLRSSCDRSMSCMASGSVEISSFPEMNSAFPNITRVLQEVVDVKNQADVLLQTFSDKEKTQFLVEEGYDYLLNIMKAISISTLTREYDRQLRECEKRPTAEKEKARLTAIFTKLKQRIGEAEDALKSLKDKFKILDQPIVELRRDYNNPVTSILKEVVGYKEMIEFTERNSSFRNWADKRFKYLKLQWENALRYSKRTSRTLFNGIKSLEEQHGAAVSCHAEIQRQIQCLFPLTEEDKTSGWVEVLEENEDFGLVEALEADEESDLVGVLVEDEDFGFVGVLSDLTVKTSASKKLPERKS